MRLPRLRRRRPPHRWATDPYGQRYCVVCWLPYTHWIGDRCPNRERVNARRPEWRPPNPPPAGVT